MSLAKFHVWAICIDANEWGLTHGIRESEECAKRLNKKIADIVNVDGLTICAMLNCLRLLRTESAFGAKNPTAIARIRELFTSFRAQAIALK